MKKIFALLFLSFFACGKKAEYDSSKLATAIINHSFYKIDPSSANILASDISELKIIDSNADLVRYKSNIVQKEQKNFTALLSSYFFHRRKFFEGSQGI